MISFFKKLVEKELEKLSWGKIKFKFNDLLEKSYVGKQSGLEADPRSRRARRRPTGPR